jgi:hypothetical protein
LSGGVVSPVPWNVRVGGRMKGALDTFSPTPFGCAREQYLDSVFQFFFDFG